MFQYPETLRGSVPFSSALAEKEEGYKIAIMLPTISESITVVFITLFKTDVCG